MPGIHPTAIVDPGAKIADDCDIGPYCVIGGQVSVDEGVRLLSHVVIDGRTTIGARPRIYPFTSLGQPPQDLKYKGEPSELDRQTGVEGKGVSLRVNSGGRR